MIILGFHTRVSHAIVHLFNLSFAKVKLFTNSFASALG